MENELFSEEAVGLVEEKGSASKEAIFEKRFTDPPSLAPQAQAQGN